MKKEDIRLEGEEDAFMRAINKEEFKASLSQSMPPTRDP